MCTANTIAFLDTTQKYLDYSTKPSVYLVNQARNSSLPKRLGYSFVALLASPLHVLSSVLNTVILGIVGIAAAVLFNKSLCEHIGNKLTLAWRDQEGSIRINLELPLHVFLNILNKDLMWQSVDAINQNVAQPIKDWAERKAKDDTSSINRYLISRLAFITFGIVSVITALYDLVIGVSGFVATTCTLARYSTLNGYARIGARSMEAVSDVVYAVMKAICPRGKD